MKRRRYRMGKLSRRTQPQEPPVCKPSSTETCATLQNKITSPVESEIQTSSSYLPTDGSMMSREVDRWIQGWENGTATDSQSPAAPKNRVVSVQRSTLTSQYGLYTNGFYYALATVMPALRAQQRSLWNCSPSDLIAALDPVFGHLGEVCNRIRLRFLHLLTDHGMQEMFTATLDIIMVIYAIGFVVISMYESAIMA